MSDVGFSGAQLALLAAVLGPLLTAIGVLFRLLLAAQKAQIEAANDALEQALATNKELSQAVKEATSELRDLRADLWSRRSVGGGGREDAR